MTEVARRMNARQKRVSAIERAKVDVSELRTLVGTGPREADPGPDPTGTLPSPGP